MTNKISSDLDRVPEACTLPTEERPLRLAEFDALFASAVDRAERPGEGRLRLYLTGNAGLADTVRDLAARERECCAFFTFTVTATKPGRVTLDVEVPADHIDVLNALADRAAAARGRAR